MSLDESGSDPADAGERPQAELGRTVAIDSSVLLWAIV